MRHTIREPGLYASLGCLHAPFHNKRFIDALCGVFADCDLNGLLLMGDILDMNSISRHAKGKVASVSGLTLGQEYALGEAVVDQITDACGDPKHKVYVWGNHEDWFNQWKAENDNNKIADATATPTKGMHMKEKGFKVLEDWKEDYVRLGKYLDVLHGSYCGVHAAKKHMDAFRSSCLFYHTHRIQQYREGDMSSHNGGWCGDSSGKAFGYATRGMKSSWANGANLVYIDDNGYYHVQQLSWINESIYYNGYIYS